MATNGEKESSPRAQQPTAQEADQDGAADLQQQEEVGEENVENAGSFSKYSKVT